ncbi:MAG: hypothetical protein II984_01800 [Clostridia bacterium]|nr:hypothetical protein [Clostridia bacterium]
MGQGIIDLYPKETYYSDGFQALWNEYKSLFDFDIDSLFGDNYAVKLRFGHFFKELIDGQYKKALSSLIAYKENFVTELDLELYKKFEQYCLNYENMKKVKSGDWIKYDFNNIFLVIDINVDRAIIKNVFYHNVRFIQSDGIYTDFNTQTTDLLCYRNVTEEELNAINAFFKENPTAYEDLNASTDMYFEICNKLKNNRFIQAQFKQGNFNRSLTDESAFIVNVKDYGKYIEIVYGITNISSDITYKNHFEKYGKDDDEITIRKSVRLYTKEDETVAKNQIQEFYLMHKDLSKDDILSISKEMRKQFINIFKELLKPCKMKKKGTAWSKEIYDSFILDLFVSKRSFIDSYDIQLSIFPKAERGMCFSKKYLFENNYNINWQLIDLEKFKVFLKEEVIKDINTIINSTKEELTVNSEIVANSHCDILKCKSCWKRQQ